MSPFNRKHQNLIKIDPSISHINKQNFDARENDWRQHGDNMHTFVDTEQH